MHSQKFCWVPEWVSEKEGTTHSSLLHRLRPKGPCLTRGKAEFLVFLKTAADTRLVFRGFKILHSLFFLKKQITRLTFHMLLISGGLFTNWLLIMCLPLSVSPDEIQDSLVTVAGQLLRTMTFQITFSFLSCSENGEGCQRAMWGWMRARIVIYIYDLTERWKQRECYSVLFSPHRSNLSLRMFCQDKAYILHDTSPI